MSNNSFKDIIDFRNFFIDNPSKILGKIKERTNQYGGIDYDVTGSISNLENIDVSDELIPQEYNPQIDSVEKTDLTESDLLILEQTEKDSKELAIIERPKTRRTVNRRGKPFQRYVDGELLKKIESAELYTEKEAFEQFNSHISEDERLAYFVFKNQHHEKYVLPTNEKVVYGDKLIIDLLEKGVLCIENNTLTKVISFSPAYLYYSGNYIRKIEKINALLNDDSKINDFVNYKFKDAQKGKDVVIQSLKNQIVNFEKKIPKQLTFNKDRGQSLIVNYNSDIFLNRHLLEGNDEQGYVFQLTDKRANEDDNRQGYASLSNDFAKWVRFNYPSNIPISLDLFMHLFWEKPFNSDASKRMLGVKEEDINRRKAEVKFTFTQFINELIHNFITSYYSDSQRKAIEKYWNEKTNTYIDPNFNKCPISFTYSKYFKNSLLQLRDAQREGVGFIDTVKGGIIAYDVGVGKTATAICHIANILHNKKAKKPLIVVPKQVYEKWIGEIRGFENEHGEVETWGIIPQYDIVPLGNLNKEVQTNLRSNFLGRNKKLNLPDNTIYICTYQALENICFDLEEDATASAFMEEYETKYFKGLEHLTEKEKEGIGLKIKNRFSKRAGLDARKEYIFYDELNFDALIIDEAHNFNHIFPSASINDYSEINEKKSTKPKDERKLISKKERGDFSFAQTPSSRGEIGFFISNYIQIKGGSVCLLTATPFSNNPLEVYSMLSLANKYILEDSNHDNINHFFRDFAEIEVVERVKSLNNIKTESVMKSWANKPVFQNLFFSVMNYKTGESVNIKRPIKHLFPKISENGIMLPIELRRNTYLEPSELQIKNKEILQEILLASLGNEELRLKAPYLVFISSMSASTFSPFAVNFNTEILEKYLDDEDLLINIEKQAKLLDKKFSYKSFVEESPKLKYTMDCMRTVIEYHKKTDTELSNAIIYTNIGKDYLTIIQEYLIKELGYKKVATTIGKKSYSEVEIIGGDFNTDVDDKEQVKELFNKGIVKVIIGTDTIKEGIDLQVRTTQIYALTVQWNPTSVKQLEGRGWRFGNIYKNIRIVTPLLIGSTDAFKYQLLEEKTARISDVFDRNSTDSILDTSEEDIEGQKMALVDNIDVLVNNKISEILKEKEIEKITLNRIYFLLNLIEPFKQYSQYGYSINFDRPSIVDLTTMFHDKILGLLPDKANNHLMITNFEKYKKDRYEQREQIYKNSIGFLKLKNIDENSFWNSQNDVAQLFQSYRNIAPNMFEFFVQNYNKKTDYDSRKEYNHDVKVYQKIANGDFFKDKKNPTDLENDENFRKSYTEFIFNMIKFFNGMPFFAGSYNKYLSGLMYNAQIDYVVRVFNDALKIYSMMIDYCGLMPKLINDAKTSINNKEYDFDVNNEHELMIYAFFNINNYIVAIKEKMITFDIDNKLIKKGKFIKGKMSRRNIEYAYLLIENTDSEDFKFFREDKKFGFLVFEGSTKVKKVDFNNNEIYLKNSDYFDNESLFFENFNSGMPDNYTFHYKIDNFEQKEFEYYDSTQSISRSIVKDFKVNITINFVFGLGSLGNEVANILSIINLYNSSVNDDEKINSCTDFNKLLEFTKINEHSSVEINENRSNQVVLRSNLEEEVNYYNLLTSNNEIYNKLLNFYNSINDKLKKVEESISDEKKEELRLQITEEIKAKKEEFSKEILSYDAVLKSFTDTNYLLSDREEQEVKAKKVKDIFEAKKPVSSKKQTDIIEDLTIAQLSNKINSMMKGFKPKSKKLRLFSLVKNLLDLVK